MTVSSDLLLCLLAIARTGSFSKAAVELGQSQPTLSNNIALLERRLGVRVLDRTRRGSTLTPQGEILARRGANMQLLLEDAAAEVRNHANGVSGPFKIGATPSVLPVLVPLALAEAGVGSGPLHVEVIEGLDEALMPRLRSGALDLIVGPVEEMFTGSQDIVEHRLLVDPFLVGIGSRSPFFSRSEVALGELADEPWILPHEGSTYRQHVEALFMTKGVPWPRNLILANSLPLQETLLERSDRVTIVSPIQFSSISRGDMTVARLEDGGKRYIGYKRRAGSKFPPLGDTIVAALEASAQMLEGRIP
jgi:DNA-binding transcriptional LysR family regulator